MMKAFEVKDGFDAVFCETIEDAQMVVRAWTKRLKAIDSNDKVVIEPVEITAIPENERKYVESLRASMKNE